MTHATLAEFFRILEDADYENQVLNNPDKQNRDVALEKLIQAAVSRERRRELDLYKNYAQDSDFKRAFNAAIGRILASKMGELGPDL